MTAEKRRHSLLLLWAHCRGVLPLLSRMPHTMLLLLLLLLSPWHRLGACRQCRCCAPDRRGMLLTLRTHCTGHTLLTLHTHGTAGIVLLPQLGAHCRDVMLTLRAVHTRLALLLLPLQRLHQASCLAATALTLALDPAALM
jgi:hypothetical protein